METPLQAGKVAVAMKTLGACSQTLLQPTASFFDTCLQGRAAFCFVADRGENRFRMLLGAGGCKMGFYFEVLRWQSSGTCTAPLTQVKTSPSKDMNTCVINLNLFR